MGDAHPSAKKTKKHSGYAPVGARLHAVGVAGFWYGTAQQSHHCNLDSPALTTLQRNPEKHLSGEFLKITENYLLNYQVK